MTTRALLILLSALVLGSAPAARAGADGSPLGVKQLDRAFPPVPARMGVMVVVPQIWKRLPYGDLAEEAVYTARSYTSGTQPLRLLGSVTLFPTIEAARRASEAIRHGGRCIPHQSPSEFATISACDHLRVANALLIIDRGDTPTVRASLSRAIRRLGAPTIS